MNFDREWTIFACDAEVDAYGTARLVKAHNAQRAEIERLRASLATARSEALEEAATFCDGYALHCDCPYPGSCAHHGAFDVAAYIRALRDSPPATAKEKP